MKGKGRKMKQILSTEKAPAAVGAYSQGIALNGLVFTSGQIPINPETGEVVTGSIVAQAEQSMKNVKAIVEAGGLTMDDIVKVTILLADIGDFGAVNEVYKSFFSGDFPARSCFAVKDLPKGVGVEIEAIAGK
jgi:2-iminobutanoate/2-iminopropanoate deaminase